MEEGEEEQKEEEVRGRRRGDDEEEEINCMGKANQEAREDIKLTNILQLASWGPDPGCHLPPSTLIHSPASSSYHPSPQSAQKGLPNAWALRSTSQITMLTPHDTFCLSLAA